MINRLKKGNCSCILFGTLLAAALSFVPTSPCGLVHAGSTDAIMRVSARVLVQIILKTGHQIPYITITKTDVLKGYIDIKNASRIEVKCNNPAGYTLTFQGAVWPFTVIDVQGFANTIRIDPGKAFVHQPYKRGTATYVLSYRFFLAKDTLSGVYAWPLSIISGPM